MANLIPDSWRRSLVHLRDDIHDAVDHWWHQRHAPDERGDSLSVRRVPADLVEEDPFFRLPSPFIPQHPAMDIEETDTEIIVTAELPGLDKDDFTVEISGNRLRIQGEKKRSAEKQEREYYYAERSYGAFARTVSLPCAIDADRATAISKNGTLHITLPKTEQARANRIKVQVQGKS
jgi:HSP20 family protein